MFLHLAVSILFFLVSCFAVIQTNHELLAKEIYSSILFHVHNQVSKQNAFPRLHPGMQLAAQKMICKNFVKFSSCPVLGGMARGKFQMGFDAFDFAFLLSSCKDSFEGVFGGNDCKRVSFHGSSHEEAYLELQRLLNAIKVPVFFSWNVTQMFFVACFSTVFANLEEGFVNWQASWLFLSELLE
jgi:hypothetical protein